MAEPAFGNGPQAYSDGPNAHGPSWAVGPLAHKMPMSSEEKLWWPESFTERLQRVRPPDMTTDPRMPTTGFTPVPAAPSSGDVFQGEGWKMPDQKDI